MAESTSQVQAQKRSVTWMNEYWFVLWAFFKIRLLCEETWRFTRRAQSRRSNARRFFFRVVHPIFLLLFCSSIFFYSGTFRFFFFYRCPKNFILLFCSPMMDIKLFYSQDLKQSHNRKKRVLVTQFINPNLRCCFFCSCYGRQFFRSAFFFPHFPIRIRHPQVSGPRFTHTR